MKQAYFYSNTYWRGDAPNDWDEMAEAMRAARNNDIIEHTLDAYTRINRRQGITSREELE